MYVNHLAIPSLELKEVKEKNIRATIFNYCEFWNNVKKNQRSRESEIQKLKDQKEKLCNTSHTDRPYVSYVLLLLEFK